MEPNQTGGQTLDNSYEVVAALAAIEAGGQHDLLKRLRRRIIRGPENDQELALNKRETRQVLKALKRATTQDIYYGQQNLLSAQGLVRQFETAGTQLYTKRSERLLLILRRFNIFGG